MEEGIGFKGLYMSIVVLEDRIRIAKNQGYSKAIEMNFDQVLFEDIDLNHIEYSPARSMIIQGYILIPLNKKINFPDTFKGKAKELKIWFNKDGNESFEQLREILMSKR